jgi:hypothetical protein
MKMIENVGAGARTGQGVVQKSASRCINLIHLNQYEIMRQSMKMIENVGARAKAEQKLYRKRYH